MLTLGTEAQAAVIRNEATRHISTPRFQGSEAENLLIFTERVNKPRVLWDYCWNTLAASFLSSYPKVKITVLHKNGAVGKSEMLALLCFYLLPRSI